MAKRINLHNNQSGFSLFEVMIALTIFAVFISVYMTTQGYNLSDSTLLKEELLLKQLCESKLNEIIVKPPEFSEALTLAPEVKTIENYEDYESSVEYKKFLIPDYAKITGKSEEASSGEDDAQGGDAKQQGIEQIIFNQVKDNMEQVLWQVKVKITNKQTGFNFELSTWLLNDKAEVNFAF